MFQNQKSRNIILNVIKAVTVLVSILSFDEGVNHFKCYPEQSVVAAVLILESWDGVIT